MQQHVTSHHATPHRAMPHHQDLWRGRYDSHGVWTMRRESAPSQAKTNPTDSVVLGEEEAVALMSTSQCMVCGDHYDWWDSHSNAPESGKPLWLDPTDHTQHHIFFDDNIHNDATDSIWASVCAVPRLLQAVRASLL